LNPYFLITFLGSLISLPLTTWFSYRSGVSLSFYLLMAATFFYAVGLFGITMMGHVPLNNTLDKVDLSMASATLMQEVRQQFESEWNRLHHIRTYAGILSFLCTILSLIKKA